MGNDKGRDFVVEIIGIQRRNMIGMARIIQETGMIEGASITITLPDAGFEVTMTKQEADDFVRRVSSGEAFGLGQIAPRSENEVAPLEQETRDPLPIHCAIANNRHVGGMGFLRDQVFWLQD